jgi:hypothetical protein
MAFVSEHSFATQVEARKEAEWLFGKLEWKPMESQLRASVILAARISN